MPTSTASPGFTQHIRAISPSILSHHHQPSASVICADNDDIDSHHNHHQLHQSARPNFLHYLGLGISKTTEHPDIIGSPTQTNADVQDVDDCHARGAGDFCASTPTAAPIQTCDHPNFKFTKPQLYECGYCNLNFGLRFKYFRHIRCHKNIIRCVGCNKSFNHVIDQKFHQRHCQYQAIL